MTIRSPALHPIKRCVIKAFGLATNQHYFGAARESLSSRKIGRIFERFLPFLGQAHRRDNPLGRLASEEVLGLNKARVSPALRQELPGDSSHQTRGGQDGEAGFLPSARLRL